jgi:hypothetical protein
MPWRPGEGARVFKTRAKLEEEGALSTALEHPGILRVLGMHKAEGAWYLITEHPEANPLADLLTLAMEGGRYFSPSFVLYVGVQVAAAPGGALASCSFGSASALGRRNGRSFAPGAKMP